MDEEQVLQFLLDQLSSCNSILQNKLLVVPQALDYSLKLTREFSGNSKPYAFLLLSDFCNLSVNTA